MIRQFSDLPASNDVVAYCVSEETPPMTMQVGMVGADGILLASDTKVFQEPLLSTGVRTEHGMSKFRVGRSVAVAVAHDMDQGMRFADELIGDDKYIGPHRDQIVRIGREIFNKEPPNVKSQCLIAFQSPTPELHFFETWHDDERRFSCYPVRDKILAGDRANSAIYWAMKHYKPVAVDLLAQLAAQMIVEAAELNTASIGGLEIVTVKPSGVGLWSDLAVKNLETRARAKTKEISKLVLGV